MLRVGYVCRRPECRRSVVAELPIPACTCYHPNASKLRYALLDVDGDLRAWPSRCARRYTNVAQCACKSLDAGAYPLLSGCSSPSLLSLSQSAGHARRNAQRCTRPRRAAGRPGRLGHIPLGHERRMASAWVRSAPDSCIRTQPQSDDAPLGSTKAAGPRLATHLLKRFSPA